MTSAAAGDEVRLDRMRWWHIPAVLELEPVLFPGHPWSAAAFWSELAGGAERHYVVAHARGQLVGYAGAALLADEAWVQTIGVAPAWQHHGIGRLLLDDLLAAAQLWRAGSVWLEVREGNVRARQVYATAGFTVAGRRPHYYPDGVDALVMTRPLARSAKAAGGPHAAR